MFKPSKNAGINPQPSVAINGIREKSEKRRKTPEFFGSLSFDKFTFFPNFQFSNKNLNFVFS